MTSLKLNLLTIAAPLACAALLLSASPSLAAPEDPNTLSNGSTVQAGPPVTGQTANHGVSAAIANVANELTPTPPPPPPSLWDALVRRWGLPVAALVILSVLGALFGRRRS